MMRLKTTLMMAAACAVLAGGGARAQLGPLQKPVNVGLRVGGFFPKSDAPGVGKNWFAAGADVRVNIGAIPIVGGQTVALDYLSRGSSNITGITLVQMFSSPIAAPVTPGGMRPYAGLGFGFYRIKVKSDIESRTKDTAGVKVVAGVDIGKGLYVQGDYHLPATGRVAGVNPKAFALTAGLRF